MANVPNGEVTFDNTTFKSSDRTHIPKTSKRSPIAIRYVGFPLWLEDLLGVSCGKKISKESHVARRPIKGGGPYD